MNAFFKKILTITLLSVSTIFPWDIPEYSADIWPSDTEHCRVSLRHIESGGIGYDEGYSTLEGFFGPDPMAWWAMPFLDVRGHVFNNGKLAANVGGGIRKVAGNVAYGVNVYYDYRNAQRKSYHQVGFGLEAVGTHADFRVNGYVPVGKTITCPFNSQFAGFCANNAFVTQNYQFAMPGMNAELGFYFGRSQYFNFYAAAGPYYYHEKIGAHFWGGKARFMVRFKEYATIELSNSYDKVFRNRFQCQLTLTLPFGKESDSYYNARDKDEVLYSRMVQPVARQEIIVEGCGKTCCPAIDPATGNPFNIVFVNNTSHSNGTFESPYPTLLLAQENSKPGYIIYVFPGDGTTRGMNQGIILQNNQKFWGSGNAHVIHTAQGDFVIPPLTTSAPKMTNTAGDGITLSATNEVSGFNLNNVVGNGIFGSIAQNIDIGQCTIDQSQLDHIHLEYGDVPGRAKLNNLTLTNAAQDAVFINAPTAPITGNISNSTFQNNAVYTIEASCANRASFSVTNNTFSQNVNGLGFNFAGTSDLLISDNNFNNTTSVSERPIVVAAGANPLSAAIRDNNISNNTCGAMHFVLNDTDGALLNITRNTINNNGTGALGSLGSPINLDPNGTTAGNCAINLQSNTFSNNAGSALFCFNGAYNEFDVNASQNTITDNGGAGLLFSNTCNTFNLNATKNTIANGGEHGIVTGGPATLTRANINIANNQITGNTNFANGIALFHQGTELNMNMSKNTISDNEGSGVIVFPTTAIENIAANIARNTVSNNQNLVGNQAGGVDIEQYTNLVGFIENNTLTNNATSGLYIGSAEAAPIACVTLVGNVSDTYTVSSGTGTFKLAPCNASALNVGTITTVGTIDPVQSCPGGAPCP